MTHNKSIVLVHGAWADGSGWSGVIQILQSEGYDVAATQHPLTSLHDDVAAVSRMADMQYGPTVLVGHSYGGAVITEAAHLCPNAKALVYIAAFAPYEDENLMRISEYALPAPGNMAVHADKHGMLWIDQGGFAQSFCHDVEKNLAAVLAVVQKPIAIQCFSDKVTHAGWKDLPCWYQVSGMDRMIAPELEIFMAERIKPIKTIHLPASHASMISYPQEIAGLIMEAARSV